MHVRKYTAIVTTPEGATETGAGKVEFGGAGEKYEAEKVVRASLGGNGYTVHHVEIGAEESNHG